MRFYSSWYKTLKHSFRRR